MSGTVLMLSFIGYVVVLCVYAFLGVRCVLAVNVKDYKLAAAYAIPAVAMACLLAKFIGF